MQTVMQHGCDSFSPSPTPSPCEPTPQGETCYLCLRYEVSPYVSGRSSSSVLISSHSLPHWAPIPMPRSLRQKVRTESASRRAGDLWAQYPSAG